MRPPSLLPSLLPSYLPFYLPSLLPLSPCLVQRSRLCPQVTSSPPPSLPPSLPPSGDHPRRRQYGGERDQGRVYRRYPRQAQTGLCQASRHPHRRQQLLPLGRRLGFPGEGEREGGREGRREGRKHQGVAWWGSAAGRGGEKRGRRRVESVSASSLHAHPRGTRFLPLPPFPFPSLPPSLPRSPRKRRPSPSD